MPLTRAPLGSLLVALLVFICTGTACDSGKVAPTPDSTSLETLPTETVPHAQPPQRPSPAPSVQLAS